MTLTQLSYIVAIDKLKNFGLAAQSCSVTQPTLSMQVQKLEEEIGIILFDRSEHPVKVTKLGKLLIDQAKIILSESQKFNDMVSDFKDETKGILKIGVIPTLAPYLVPLFIKNFSNNHPTLKVVVEELQTHEVLNKLSESELDVGLLVTPIEKSGMVTFPLFYEPFLTYVSENSALYKQSKVDQKDLNSSDLWLLSEGHCFREQSLLLCKNRKRQSDQNKNLTFESGSLETLKKMVDQENGFTLLPYLASQDVKNSKKLKEFSGVTPTREVSLIFLNTFKKEKIRKSLIESIQQGIPKELVKSQARQVQVVDLPMGRSKSEL